jgi:hypothetical protein
MDALAEKIMEPSVEHRTLVIVKSPRAAIDKTGIFEVPPMLSYDSIPNDRAGLTSVYTPTEVTSILKDFRHRFVCLKLKSFKAFQDIESSHLMVTSDIQQLADTTKFISGNSGDPVSIGGLTHSPVWQTMSCLFTMLNEKTHELRQGFKQMSQIRDSNRLHLDNLQLELANKDSIILDLQSILQQHESRFT